MSTQLIRSPGPLPRLHVVDPEGYVRAFPYARNINNGVVEVSSGRPRLTHEARDKRYLTLEEAYAQDPRESLRKNGMRIYLDWDRAARKKQAPRKEVELDGGKKRNATAEFPRELLPQEAIRRQVGTSNISKVTWEAPNLDNVEIDVETGEVMGPDGEIVDVDVDIDFGSGTANF